MGEKSISSREDEKDPWGIQVSWALTRPRNRRARKQQVFLSAYVFMTG